MLKEKIELSCDLCQWPAKTFNSELKAMEAGWLKIGQESYYEDRCFSDSFVCPSCVKKILDAKAKGSA